MTWGVENNYKYFKYSYLVNLIFMNISFWDLSGKF